MGHKQSKHPEFFREQLKKEGYCIVITPKKEKRR